jgi:RNA polymerase sigma-70 factor, ECF subfamily
MYVARTFSTSMVTEAASVSFDWAYLYERYAGELLGYLAKLVGDRERASELMQDTFVRALRSDHTIREPAAVKGWLYQTATHLALNERRRNSILRFLPFSGAERQPGDVFDADAAQVRTALRSISSREAAVLLLRYHNGFSRSEIAVMLGLGDEAVKSRLARGRKSFMAAYSRLEREVVR